MCGTAGVQLSDVAVSARAAAALPRGLQHSGDRRAAAHHAGVREEAGIAMSKTSPGALQMNIETKEGLFALMEQIAEEREAARPIVERLVTSGEPLEDIETPEGWRTAGMVLELCERATAKNESDPRLSLVLAQI